CEVADDQLSRLAVLLASFELGLTRDVSVDRSAVSVLTHGSRDAWTDGDCQRCEKGDEMCLRLHSVLIVRPCSIVPQFRAAWQAWVRQFFRQYTHAECGEISTRQV